MSSASKISYLCIKQAPKVATVSVLNCFAGHGIKIVSFLSTLSIGKNLRDL